MGSSSSVGDDRRGLHIEPIADVVRFMSREGLGRTYLLGFTF